MRRFPTGRTTFDLPRPRKTALRACWWAVQSQRCVADPDSATLDGFRFTFHHRTDTRFPDPPRRYSLRAQELADGSTRITVQVEGSPVTVGGHPDLSATLPLFLLKERAMAELERMAPAKSLFVSYRRDDSADVTGRILDRLRGRFGSDAMFRDVDDVREGVDFRQAVESALRDARALLAVIGPRWAGKSENRLHLPDDMIRIELETAFAGELPILPILVSGAAMPGKELLPGSLRFVCDLNAPKVRPDPDFDRDMQDLIDRLAPRLEAGRPGSS